MQPDETNVIPFPVQRARKPAEVQFDESGLPIRWVDRVLRSKVSKAAKAIAIRLFVIEYSEPDLDRVTPQWLMHKTGDSKSSVYRAIAQLKEHRFIDDDLDPIETQEDLLGYEETLRRDGQPPREEFIRKYHAKFRTMAVSA